MKLHFWKSAALIFLAATSLARADVSPEATPSFLSLYADHPSGYSLGQKAVLMAYVKIQPVDPRYGLYFESSLGGEPIQITRLSDTRLVSVSPVLDRIGNLDWQVDVYLVDAKLLSELQGTIAFYETEIFELERKIETETDPDKLEALHEEIARDHRLIAIAQDRLRTSRRLIEVGHLTIDVEARLAQDPNDKLELPLFDVYCDHLYLEYQVGESTRVQMRVNRTLTGTDGVRENIVRATLDGQAVSVQQIDAFNFETVTAAWTSGGIGKHLINASLLSRSKAQADSLREGISLADTRRTQLIALAEVEIDPMKKARLLAEVNDLTAAIGAFYAQLESILTPVETRPFGFEVVE